MSRGGRLTSQRHAGQNHHTRHKSHSRLNRKLLGGYWAWDCWHPVALEHRRYAAGEKERDYRQAGIDEAFRKWNERLENRPSDAEMAEWLERDRTVLLGLALDYFRLPRSRLVAHGFLEKPIVARSFPPQESETGEL
jgi:hypothetical protein